MAKRTLPLWMRDADPSPPLAEKKQRIISDSKLNETSAKTVADVNAPKLTDESDQENVPRRRLRSNFKIPDEGGPKREPEIKINIDDVPFIEYSGKICYYTDWRDMACACDQLIQWVDKQPSEMVKVPIAFDLEWPFNFQTGPGRTALMQLCAEIDCCYLFQISCVKKLPAAMLQLLHHPRVQLHGVNVKNDFRKLARDFPEANADTMIGQCVDLGQWYNQIHGSAGLWSMERLVLQVCRLRIDKNKKVRMSKWHVLPLTDDQKMYAAVDAYIGQQIYLKLQEKELKLEQERQELERAIESPSPEQ
ncbi:3'-5' exonuclease [Topomyia yanbarensis]|uniref:3'-5' exonuclease n=1 Tax=Topomyia yanbarensis TaxID=2498891 RepID=UPI00273C30E5|nr:3'-5' exonuclease [Topomyia yanbarensis]